MDKNRFDELTRGFAATRSRRGVLKALGAAALAVAGFGGDAEAAPCVKVGKACGTKKAACCKGSACTDGVCVCTPDCSGGTMCGSDGCGGVCGSCPIEQTCCGNGTCADLSADPANCGACGHACKPGQSCASGGCVAVVKCKKASKCPPAPVCQAAVCSGGVCSTVGDPSQNGASCGGGLVCQNGACVPPCKATTCSALGLACGSAPDGCGDTLDCGSCSDGQTCVNGQCQTPPPCNCKPGGGCCLPTDPTGTCQGGVSPAACGFDGTCQVCGAGQDCCNGGCLDVQSDPDNCGACAHVCGSGSCVNGSCACASDGDCGQNEACCGGVCVNILMDAANCGGCGAVCPANENCMAGSCSCGLQGGCAAGDVCCVPQGNPNASACANLPTDPRNCGGCGNDCGPNGTCSNGGCVGCSPNGLPCPNSNAPCCSGFCDLTNGVCATPPCVPATTCPAGQTCGAAPDGCGDTINCGICDANQCLACMNGACASICQPGQSCVGGQCSSVPTSCTPATASTACPAQHAMCGQVSDGCGGLVNCGMCNDGVCVSGQCPGATTCTPASAETACAARGFQCGMVSDGCSKSVGCGACQNGQICVNGQCVGSSCVSANQPCAPTDTCCNGSPCAGFCI